MTDPIPQEFHAHIYFDGASRDRAFALKEKIAETFPTAEIGRFHEQPIGPHPKGSCQVAFSLDLFDQIVPWLMVNRDDVTIFLHAETGDDLTDHRDRTLWLGQQVPIKLDIFEG